MFLHKAKKKDGRIYLTLMEAYRKDGKPANKTIKSLGYVDALEEQYPDPIAYFTDYCKAQNELAKQARQSVSIDIHPLQKIDKRTQNRKNIGSVALLSIYNAMNLEQLFRNVTRNKKTKFDLNAVVRLLVCERILNPASKLKAWQNKDSYFFRTEFEEYDVYRALDILSSLRERVVSAINRYIDSLGIRDTSRAYYDVTNYYFEIDDPDELRRYGVSKEHRKSPIVQMGLLQDKNAIPITYKLFSGNTNDCETMLDVLYDMKKDYRCSRVIVVADKGNNTSTNIAACVGKGDGFVYSQSIRGTKSNKELREWVTSDEGYKTKGDNFKIKSRQGYKSVTVQGPDGKPKKVDIEVKYVAFWSEKYALRARYERQKSLEKAHELISNPGAYSAATHYGAAKYISGTHFDPKTGEILEGARTLSLDEKRIRAEEACDGYYCIVTSEYNMPDEEIIETYRGLWRIEESFKVTKSDLVSRPVYCSTPEHIESHFLTCYVALCILRILQLKCGNRYSAGEIADELSLMSGTNFDENWWCFDHRTDVTDDICSSLGIDLTQKFMQLKEIKDLLAQVNHK